MVWGKSTESTSTMQGCRLSSSKDEYIQEGGWFSEYTKQRIILFTREGKRMKEVIKNNSSSWSKLMNWYLDFDLSFFILYQQDPPQWSLWTWSRQIDVYNQYNVQPLSIIKSWNYVVSQGSFLHSPFPGNGANLLSLQETLCGCRPKVLGNLRIQYFSVSGSRGY